jgi:hypothetical protein
LRCWTFGSTDGVPDAITGLALGALVEVDLDGTTRA